MLKNEKSFNAQNSGKCGFSFPSFMVKENKPEQVHLYLPCLLPLPKTPT